jgi:superfamily I DNA/RNA helicase
MSGLNIMMDREYGKFLRGASNHCSEEVQKTLNTLGVDYLIEEIEQIIFGNNLICLEDYLSVERRGRKRGLNAKERANVWALFEKFKEVAHSEKKITWGWMRVNALEKLKRDPKPKFNALFVDEAQDLSKVSRQICLALVKSEKNLVFAADTGQSIYAVPTSWIQVDPKLDFRRKRPILLANGYRTTYEINSAISFLRNDPGDEQDASINAKSVFHGDYPYWLNANKNEMVNRVIEIIESLDTDPFSRINKGHIAVIVRKNEQINQISEALAKEGYTVNVVSKLSPVDLESDAIHVLTAHASKGLGFPVAIVPYVSQDIYPPSFSLSKAKDEEQIMQVMENEQRLLYVALSRASHKLFMISDQDKPSSLLKGIRSELWNKTLN